MLQQELGSIWFELSTESILNTTRQEDNLVSYEKTNFV